MKNNNSIATTSTILKNIAFFENLMAYNQENCTEHIPVILGDTNTPTISYNGENIRVKYKRCILCGKVLTFEKPFTPEEYEETTYYDASEYKSEKYSSANYDNKFLELLNEYEYLSRNISDEKELKTAFTDLINNNKNVSKKRVITEYK